MTVFAPDIPGSMWNADSAVNSETHGLYNRLRSALATARDATGRWTDLIASLDNACMDAATTDWDGAGGHAILAGSYKQAQVFLELLPAAFPAPLIGVDADGEVTLEWIRGAHAAFSVSISAAGDLTYAGLFGPARARGKEPLGTQLPRAIIANLQRLSALG
jgi:hypothetical protein